MIVKYPPVFILMFIVLGLFIVFTYRQRLARMRFLETIRAIAETDASEIKGHSVDYWLNILNQDSIHTIIAIETFIVKFKGQQFFFLYGQIPYIVYSNRLSAGKMEGFFLVAVGESTAKLLLKNADVFRLCAGCTGLATFSIYRWSRFVAMLKDDCPGD
jgi:hypothetical protein